MDNNERFNQLLNGCQNPRAVYNALLALGRDGALDGLRKATGGGASMKYQQGAWRYRGRVYATLHEALRAVWP